MQPGTQLGHYTIFAAIGKGGMGEVWKATDTKLGRQVAIKTLPEEFAKDSHGLLDRTFSLRTPFGSHPSVPLLVGRRQHRHGGSTDFVDGRAALSEGGCHLEKVRGKIQLGCRDLVEIRQVCGP